MATHIKTKFDSGLTNDLIKRICFAQEADAAERKTQEELMATMTKTYEPRGLYAPISQKLEPISQDQHQNWDQKGTMAVEAEKDRQVTAAKAEKAMAKRWSQIEKAELNSISSGILPDYSNMSPEKRETILAGGGI